MIRHGMAWGHTQSSLVALSNGHVKFTPWSDILSQLLAIAASRKTQSLHSHNPASGALASTGLLLVLCVEIAIRRDWPAQARQV